MRRRKRFRAADYRTRVIVCEQDSTATANDDGEIPETEKEMYLRWARVHPVRGRERDVNDQLQADVTHLVTMRYDTATAAITHENWLKIRKGGDRLNILRAYDPDRRRREIVMECVQRI